MMLLKDLYCDALFELDKPGKPEILRHEKRNYSKASKNKNRLRTTSAQDEGQILEIYMKIQPQLKITGSFTKNECSD